MAWQLLSLLLVCLWHATAGQGEASNLSLYTGAGQQAGPASGGSCGYGVLDATMWPFGAIGSVNSNSSVVAGLGSNGCGACVQISCANQSACATNQAPVVLIVDSCAQCSLTIPAPLFALLAPTRLGGTEVIVEQVPCRPTNNIQIRILELRATAGGYLKLTLLDVAGGGALSSVAVRQYGTNGPFLDMTNSYGAVWEGSELPGFPLDLELVAEGETIVVQGAITATSTGTIPTIFQFPLAAAPTLAPSQALPLSPAQSPAQSPAPAGLAPTPSARAPSQALGPSATTISPKTPAPASVGTTVPSTQAPAPTPAAALGTGPDGCSTVLAVLESQPSLTTWVALLQANGDGPALTNTALRLTMFAPSNAAFSTPLTSTPQTASQLLAANANVQAPLIGYHIVGGYFPSSALTPNTTLTTTDYVQAPGGTRDSLTVLVEAGLVLQAIGSSATITTPNLAACGSVIHIIDGVLLPFNASATG